MKAQPKKTIKLALQGGGSHGAFTWGVLDQLLEDERIRIEAVSGTSAGAMNAVALADGMARGGPAEARKCLERFWSATSAAAQYSPIRRSIFDKFMGNWSLDTSPAYILMGHLSRIFSPYDTNPMNFNPLRDVVGKCVDFDAVNDARGPKIFLAATNVRTGKPKIFRRPGSSSTVSWRRLVCHLCSKPSRSTERLIGMGVTWVIRPSSRSSMNAMRATSS